MPCGCVDTCACFLVDSDTVSITGTGTSGNPFQLTVIPDPNGCLENTPNGVGIKLDPTSPATITCGPDGLRVECCPICVADSDTVTLSIDEDGCITAEVVE